MIKFFHGFGDSIHHAMKNPFGLDFHVKDKEIYVPLGNVINCIGYNDYLERIVGVARIAFGLMALVSCEDKKDKMLAAGHIFRGLLEMSESFELYLLVLDLAFTIYNVATKYFPQSSPKIVIPLNIPVNVN